MTTVLADPALYAYIGGAPPTHEKLETRYRRWVAGSPRPEEAWHNWIIRGRDGGAAMGHLQATITAGGGAADLGWVIGTAWQGRGYASEAARALVDWLATQGVGTITALVHPDNVASARVAAKAGFSPTDDLVDGEVVWRASVRSGADQADAGSAKNRSRARSRRA